jgi:hypothetical protein
LCQNITARTGFYAQDDDSFTALFEPAIVETCPGDDWEDLITTKRIKPGHRAFQSSLWYSHPEEESQVGISLNLDTNDPRLVNERFTILLNNIHSPVLERFDQRIRDNLLVMLAAMNQSAEHLQSVQTEFPSPASMDILAQRFLTKQDNKVDSWIHSTTFKPDSTLKV